MRKVRTINGHEVYVPEQSVGEVESYVVYTPDGIYVGEMDLTPFLKDNRDNEYLNAKRKIERMQLQGYIIHEKTY